MLPDFRIRQRDYLLEIARSLTEELDQDALLERILNIAIEMLAGQAGLITLQDESRGWRVAASHGIHPAFLSYLEPLLTKMADKPSQDDTVIGEINRLLKDLTYTASLGLLSGVGLPLVARQQVVGVIFIFRSYPDLFSNNDRNLLSSFANQAAIAVQNAQLFTLVSHQKQRLDALLDSAADGILILTADRRVDRANPAFSRMLGVPLNRIINRRHEEIICWEGYPQGLTLETAEAGGWPLTPNAYLYVEGDLKRGEQMALPVGITYAPLLSPEGKLLNVIVTVRDITRFRQAEELKSTFISVISHELKTPVALIKGYVATLRREDASWDPTVVNDSLQVIEEEADHLTGLIDDMLDASRLQAGGLSLKRAEVSLYVLANRLARRFQTQTTQHKIIIDIPADLPVVVADESRISQVLSNLISNAIKYSPSGEVRITSQVRPEQIIICVSDQGPGIAAGDIPHVFDRFYRSPDISRKTKGTGLGLFLARAIIEAHGGRIWVDPRLGEGALICFSLPR